MQTRLPVSSCLGSGAVLLWVLAGSAVGFGQTPSSGASESPAAEIAQSEPAGSKNPEGAVSPPPEPTANPAEGSKEEKPEWYSVHGQATVIGQGNWKFRSPYEGQNSLLPLL